jgi:hypothetical protein
VLYIINRLILISKRIDQKDITAYSVHLVILYIIITLRRDLIIIIIVKLVYNKYIIVLYTRLSY